MLPKMNTKGDMIKVGNSIDQSFDQEDTPIAVALKKRRLAMAAKQKSKTDTQDDIIDSIANPSLEIE